MKVKLIRDRLTPTGPGVSIEQVQVLKDLAALHGIAWHEVMAAAAQKEMERGGFCTGRVLVCTGRVLVCTGRVLVCTGPKPSNR